MANLKFSHDGKNYVVKGEWEKNTFTAQAFAGKKAVSAPFSVERKAGKGETLAEDDALENIVMEACKADVENGGPEEQPA